MGKVRSGSWHPYSGAALCRACSLESGGHLAPEDGTEVLELTLCDRCGKRLLLWQDVALLHRAAKLVTAAGGQASVDHTGGGCTAAVFPIEDGTLVLSDITDEVYFYPGQTWHEGPAEDAEVVEGVTAMDPEEVASLALSMQGISTMEREWKVVLRRRTVEFATTYVEAHSSVEAEVIALKEASQLEFEGFGNDDEITVDSVDEDEGVYE